MGRLFNLLVPLIAIAGGFYQLFFKPRFAKAGVWRQIEPIGNKHCTAVAELQACEKIVLHQPSGILYLACSTPQNRLAWLPSSNRFNASSTTFDDYVATYDHASSRVTRMKLKNFRSPRGLSVHGMDVVPSTSNPSKLFVYLINHRPPKDPQRASMDGADSCVEIFTANVGSDTLTHVRTVEDPVIACPNDVVGYPDGQSFYVTNDHGEKTGFLRKLEPWGRASGSVGYCHAKSGCRYAFSKMQLANGITRAQNDTIYVASSIDAAISVLERQADDSLVITDVIRGDRFLDNISLDSKGALWVAGFPHIYALYKHFENPVLSAPSSALRLSINTGVSSFYGEKYKLDKVFEDDGNIASGTTSVVHDAERHLLFLHGILAPHLSVCKV